MNSRVLAIVRNASVVVFLLTLFWQTRIDFFSSYELYDYFIPFVYLSDVLILINIVLWLVERRRNRYQIDVHPKWIIASAVIFLVAVSIGVMFSEHWEGALYRLLKIGGMIGFGVWVAYDTYVMKPTRVFVIIALGLLPLVFLGFTQVLLGHTLGLKIIGEWYFSVSNLSVATVHIGGLKLLRPYATFPHPNVFGGLLAAITLALLAIYIKKRKLISYKLELLFRLTMVVLFLGVLISFSRSAWIAFGIGSGYLLFKNFQEIQSLLGSELRKRAATIVAFTLAVLALVQVSKLLNHDYLSFGRRYELNSVALKMFKDNFFIGVGINQFLLSVDTYWNIESLARFVQPVHNVVLLVLAETGITGFISWFWFMVSPVYVYWTRLPDSIRVVWIVIGVTSTMDHYWWTLQAGMLLVFLTWGLSLATIERKSNYAK